MKKLQFSAVAALILFAVTGCISDVKVDTTPQPVPVAPQPAPVRLQTQADANFSVSDEVNTKLRVYFNWSSSEASFSRKLAQRLAGSVVIENAELLRNGTGDVLINIAPEFELMDKSGNYYRILCNQINVSINSNSKVYAMTTIEPKALPRKLGVQKAKDQYIPQASSEISAFLKKELDRISSEEIAVSVLNFTLENVQENPTSDFVAKRIAKITNVLNSTSGIINYLNIRQDVSKATCSFRVVYLKKQFPQGVANVINMKLAGK